MSDFKHTTVLLDEAIDHLSVQPTGTYIDATLGGGGHTNLLLSHLDQAGKLLSFDQDATAITFNQERFQAAIKSQQLRLIHRNFAELQATLSELDIAGIDGIVYDLGVSSVQFDDGQRGFSYNYDADLDMRMDQRQTLTAKMIVNEWSFNDLMRIFSRYGDEPFAKQIARQIEKQRSQMPISTTFELVEIIKSALPAKALNKKGHPAKRTFQALRIAVNDELGVLESSLEQAAASLNPGGRISIITFQSLEDRLVKNYFRELSTVEQLPAGLPIRNEKVADYQLITKKPISPSESEIENNHRAHSAKLRVIEKTNQIANE